MKLSLNVAYQALLKNIINKTGLHDRKTHKVMRQSYPICLTRALFHRIMLHYAVAGSKVFLNKYLKKESVTDRKSQAYATT